MHLFVALHSRILAEPPVMISQTRNKCIPVHITVHMLHSRTQFKINVHLTRSMFLSTHRPLQTPIHRRHHASHREHNGHLAIQPLKHSQRLHLHPPLLIHSRILSRPSKINQSETRLRLDLPREREFGRFPPLD